MMVSTNFRWKSYCNYIGLNSDNVFQLLEDVKTLMKIASILLISTVIQIIITSFIINFLVFIPFAKAYCSCCGNSKVYKKMLYEQIRSGEHECLRFTRSFINQIMNLIQLVTISIFRRNGLTRSAGQYKGGDNLMEQLTLILTVGCGDDNLQHVLRNIQSSLDFIDQWYLILFITCLLNVFVDFGLPLSYGNTYSTFIRKCQRCIMCKRCRRKLRKMK